MAIIWRLKNYLMNTIMAKLFFSFKGIIKVDLIANDFQLTSINLFNARTLDNIRRDFRLAKGLIITK